MYGHAEIGESTTDMTEDEWLEARRERIGASDVAGILGVSQFKTPIDVWRDKTGRPRETDESYRMRRGLYLEELLLDEFEREMHAEIDRAESFLEHPELPIGTELDGWWADGGENGEPVEAKTSNGFLRTEWRRFADGGEVLKDSLIEDYVVQVHAQMVVTGTQSAWMAVDVDGEFMVIPVERSGDLAKLILDEVERFWNEHVFADEMPDVERADDLANILDLYEWGDGEVELEPGTELHDELAELKSEYEDLRDAGKSKLKKADKLKAEMAALMAEHTDDGVRKVSLEDGSVYEVSYSRDDVDQKRLEAEYPDVYDECTDENDVQYLGMS